MVAAGHGGILLLPAIGIWALAVVVTGSISTANDAASSAPLMESAAATSVCLSGETCQDDAGSFLVELLQTGLEVGSLPQEGANMTSPQTDGPIKPCHPWPFMSAEPTPVNLQQLLVTMRFMGFLPEKSRRDCTSELETVSALAVNQESSVTMTLRSPINQWIHWLKHLPPAMWVFIVYLVIVFVVIMRVFYTLHSRPSLAEGKGTNKVANFRPEQASWNQGLTSWIAVSWATPWIARWGHDEDATNTTKIKSRDLGLSGFASDEASNAVDDWNRLWRQDIKARGTKVTNMYMVMIRFCTFRKIVTLSVASALYEVLMYLAPTFALDWTLKYIDHLQIQKQTDPSAGNMEHLLKPMLIMVFFFTGLPLLMAIFNTVAGMVAMRMNLRLEAALMAAVFQKAQRMPLSGGHYDLSEKSEERDKKNAMGSVGDGSAADVGRDYSLVQLINSDINGNLMGFQNSLSKVCLMIPITLALLLMLCLRLGKATCVVLVMIVVILIVFWFSCRMQVIRLAWYQATAGARLAFFQEAMHAVRMIKSNAWEPVVSTICCDTRSQELTQLGWFWAWMGFTCSIIMSYPKLIVLSGFMGYIKFNDSIEATDIFVMMQILSAFKNSAMALFALLPGLVNVGPSVLRVDKMLKLEEAPVPGPKDSALTGKWMTVWPDRRSPDKELAVRIQGSFMYPTTKQMCMHNVDLQVAKGEMVAIMGEVGAGKTTLLHALLGELSPTRDAHLEIPPKIAFHGQQPLICEATLKENVLYWSDFNETRYKKAIYSACLLSDLELLPGGDMVTVGSRGIALSGGQRARVSLARAAYSDADAVICDDPFAAVDQPTGKHILEHCLMGPLMKDKARIVVCQPDRHRVKAFDRIVIMEDNRICMQGPPEEIIRTQKYQALLSRFEAQQVLDEPVTTLATASKPGEGPQHADHDSAQQMGGREPPTALRDEEHEGRAEWATFSYFFSIGRYRNMVMAAIFNIGQVGFLLLSDIVMARWSNAIQYNRLHNLPRSSDMTFLWAQFFWFLIGISCFLFYWYFGARWTLNISGQIHNTIMQNLCTAPVDRFYDKTPVGRIMNRCSFDLFEVDIQLFTKLAQSVSQTLVLLVPMIYVHAVMPFYLLFGSIPFYVTLYFLAKRYWNVMIPLRYLNSVTRSDVNAYITDVEHGSICSRAYQVSDVLASKEMEAVDQMLKAGYGTTVVSRWVCNRVLVMYSLFCTIVAVIGVATQSNKMVGTVGLCLSNIIGIIMSAESYLMNLTEAQFQFISMNRLHEYTSLPTERASMQATDYKYNSPVVQVQRQVLEGLEVRTSDNRLKVVRRKPGRGGDKDTDFDVILVQHPSDESLIPPPGKTISVLDPTCQALQYTAPWHRVHTVNGIGRDAAKMAQELCQGNNAVVWLAVRSGWLTGGARVVLKDLVAGYADFPQNILHGINLTVEAKSKVAIAGTTGCGKSTMILCLLRLLEPRGGKIEINKVDLQDVGLLTLRKSMGLVPQDPVLFTGTIRNNLDPFNSYTDEEVWDCLRSVQLDQFIFKMGGGLDSYVRADGENLSFGQKQLLSIARQILKKPELMMLDECTSAIDPHTQELVANTIRSGFHDATLIAVAHRLETIMDFDIVVVMQKGHIIEKGSIQELANTKNSFFAKMLEAKGQ